MENPTRKVSTISGNDEIGSFDYIAEQLAHKLNSEEDLLDRLNKATKQGSLAKAMTVIKQLSFSRLKTGAAKLMRKSAGQVSFDENKLLSGKELG